jgi:hypothetical protein
MFARPTSKTKSAGTRRKAKKAKTHTRITRPRLDPERVYSRAEAALTLGVSNITLIRARDAGELQELRAGCRVLHTGQNLIDWLAAGGRTAK